MKASTLKKLRQYAVVSLGLLLAAGSQAWAEVKPAGVFSDHMVLQRDRPVPVWGSAAPGEKVTVEFDGKSQVAEADASGVWKVVLDPMPASATPGEMKIAGKNQITLKDVLVGEVWVGSGQSNMANPAFGSVPETLTGEKTTGSFNRDANLLALIKQGSYPQLRFVTGRPPWQLSTPENLMRFSALLQSFGVPLQKKLNVPVGLMLAAVGGTSSGRWLRPEAIAQDPACQKAIAEANKSFSMESEQKKYAETLKKHEADLAAWEQLPEAERKSKRKPEAPKPPARPGESQFAIGDLHDLCLKPFIGYAIRGVLWDQGEGGTAIVGIDQYTLMGALIRSWRQEWEQGDFPFLYVQKPSGGGCAFDYADPVFGWASDQATLIPAVVPNNPGDGEYVETHIRISTYPNTYMVPSSDLGGETHPHNKSGYGSRAAQVALGRVYGGKIQASGPVYASHQIEGNKVVVRFTEVGQGLCFRNSDRLQGFAIAGKDKVFAWADATIESSANSDQGGGTVVLSSPKISQPVFVRYAWSKNHTWANLFNKDGLPAQTFRTDK